MDKPQSSEHVVAVHKQYTLVVRTSFAIFDLYYFFLAPFIGLIVG
jgi:hypothetical protein